MAAGGAFEQGDAVREFLLAFLAEMGEIFDFVGFDRGFQIADVFYFHLRIQIADVFWAHAFDAGEAPDVHGKFFLEIGVRLDLAGAEIFIHFFGDGLADAGQIFQRFDAAFGPRLFDLVAERIHRF